jgi:hypothetical protein
VMISCLPYACADGACLQSCADSDSCGPGRACDPATSTCK